MHFSCKTLGSISLTLCTLLTLQSCEPDSQVKNPTITQPIVDIIPAPPAPHIPGLVKESSTKAVNACPDFNELTKVTRVLQVRSSKEIQKIEVIKAQCKNVGDSDEACAEFNEIKKLFEYVPTEPFLSKVFENDEYSVTEKNLLSQSDKKYIKYYWENGDYTISPFPSDFMAECTSLCAEQAVHRADYVNIPPTVGSYCSEAGGDLYRNHVNTLYKQQQPLPAGKKLKILACDARSAGDKLPTDYTAYDAVVFHYISGQNLQPIMNIDSKKPFVVLGYMSADGGAGGGSIVNFSVTPKTDRKNVVMGYMMINASGSSIKFSDFMSGDIGYHVNCTSPGNGSVKINGDYFESGKWIMVP